MSHLETIRHKTSKPRRLCMGIITIPHPDRIPHGNSHIMKSYTDWFESVNVSVIPIPYDTKDYELYFHLTNGLFIPGGDTAFIMKNDKFVNTITRFFELSLTAGEYYPIWGTCFGFQLLIFMIGGFTQMGHYPAKGLYPITIQQKGRMLGSFPERYLQYLEHKRSSLQNHELSIGPEEFMANLHLKRFFTILATAKDDKGQEYVTAIEGKWHPVYGVQSHPERQKTAQPYLQFILSELRKNKHRCQYAIPHVRSIMKSYKCTFYQYGKTSMCYYF